MVDHLNLAIDMYLDDDSGELKDKKEVSTARTFDDNDALNCYARLVTARYGGQNADVNADGLEKLKATRAGGGGWLLLQSEGVLLGEEIVWAAKRIVCDEVSAATMRYSINVPVDKTPTPSELIAETIVFCHNRSDERWSRVMVDQVHARRQLYF
ncbi:hypothetical protein LQW54_001743 [Pestalotiopsis sp. IQ-011]